MDKLTPAERSAVMARIGQKNTAPEMVVRRAAHRLGFRYRLHRNDLPGKPDLVFPGRRRAIFVHGCFWHAHSCKIGRIPQSRTDYWVPKLARTRARDERNTGQMVELGWTVMVLWECELRDAAALDAKLIEFLTLQPLASRMANCRAETS